MDDLLAARLQMAFSLGFHIVFACIGMTMPWLMAWAQLSHLRHGDAESLRLARAWAKGVAVLFAVGAVSGTVLSFELGLLWPRFMQHAGPIIGLPFSWEGTAFFVEAIALGLFLYGWDRLSPRVHLASGVVVGIAGVASGVLVVAANGWMNSPAGFRIQDGEVVDVDPVAAMLNAAWPVEALHMLLAAFAATGFAVAGIHALRLLASPGHAMHSRALKPALGLGSMAALLLPLSGDLSAKSVAVRQPEKLAAMEAHYHTRAGAPLLLGGLPDDATSSVRFGVEIPYALSLLAFGDPGAVVTGLDAFALDERPPTLVCHLAFQVMVGVGTLLAGFALGYFVMLRVRPAWLCHRRFLRVVVALAPLGFVAVEAGWVVTEVGRQPWIVYRVMRTADALTPMPGLVWSLALSLGVYLFLCAVTLRLFQRLVLDLERDEGAHHG